LISLSTPVNFLWTVLLSVQSDTGPKGKVRPELLHVVVVDAVPDQAVKEEAASMMLQTQAGSATGGHYAAHTVFMKQLHEQQWVNLRYDIMRKNCFNSCINK
jgi:hypothetical protein